MLRHYCVQTSKKKSGSMAGTKRMLSQPYGQVKLENHRPIERFLVWRRCKFAGIISPGTVVRDASEMPECLLQNPRY